MIVIISIFWFVSWIILRTILELFAHFEIEGLENVKGLKGPAIVIVNHSSYIDPFALGCAIPVCSDLLPIRFMTIIDAYESSRFVSFVLKLFGCIKLDQNRPRSAIRKALKFLPQSQVIGFFPEGTRSPDGQLMAFENGVDLILSHYNKENNNALPVLPVVILGTFRPGSGIRSWFKKASEFFRRQYHIKVVFGEPIYDELENRYHALYDSVKTQYSEASI